MEYKDDQNCYQANQDEQNYGYFPQYSLTGHIAITLNKSFKMCWRDEMTFGLTNSWHGDHEEVDTVPVGEALAVVEVGRVARVLQLKYQHKLMLHGAITTS